MANEKNDNSPISRLREFVKWAQSQGLCSSEYDFEKQCGLGNRYIYNNTVKTKGGMTTDSIALIVKTYPQINLRWLIVGEGDMVADDDTERNKAYKIAMKRYKLNIDYKKAYELAVKQMEILNNIILKANNP